MIRKPGTSAFASSYPASARTLVSPAPITVRLSQAGITRGPSVFHRETGAGEEVRGGPVQPEPGPDVELGQRGDFISQPPVEVVLGLGLRTDGRRRQQAEKLRVLPELLRPLVPDRE